MSAQAASAALVVPGTPLLLAGTDRGEPPGMTRLRQTMEAALRVCREWTVVIPAACGAPDVEPHDASAGLPPLLSLGGVGIPRGIRLTAGPHAGGHDSGGGTTVTGADLLDRDALERAVAHLRAASPDGTRAAEHTPLGPIVAALAAVEAGVRVRLCTARAAIAGSSPLLVPLDFSGAAHADGPLAPVDSAAEFDAQLERALTDGIDATTVRELDAIAEPRAAWTAGLTAALAVLEARATAGRRRDRRLTGTLLARTDAHRVRYRLMGLAGQSCASGGERP